jgi:hypothetical protein
MQMIVVLVAGVGQFLLSVLAMHGRRCPAILEWQYAKQKHKNHFFHGQNDITKRPASYCAIGKFLIEGMLRSIRNSRTDDNLPVPLHCCRHYAHSPFMNLAVSAPAEIGLENR